MLLSSKHWLVTPGHMRNLWL